MNQHSPTSEELNNALSESEVNEFKTLFADSETKKEAIYKLANHLIEKYHVKTIKGSKREVFIYKDGIYISGEEILKMEIRNLIEELGTTHTIKEIVETIKDLTPIDRSKFVTDVNLLNLENGILDIRNRELKPHNPNYLFLTKIPVTYDPEADCPIIKKFLDDVLDEEQTLVIQEWFGYALYREYFIKKAIIFVGEGDTGKTTLMTLKNDFFGEKNVSGISLQKISSDKFACANLYQKHINLSDDLSFKDINDNGVFKIATGGGIITGEKKFGDQFQFKNYSKLTFACNKIPDIKDTDDDAYFNRWIVIQFSYFVEEKDKDKQLIHKMTTKKELSGLLNFAMAGLERLLKNQRFSYDKNANEIKAEMLRSGSSIGSFASDCLEESVNEWVTKTNMHNAYIHYARINKLPIASMKKFGNRFTKYAPYVGEARPVDPNTGKQITGTAWMNVKLKDIS